MEAQNYYSKLLFLWFEKLLLLFIYFFCRLSKAWRSLTLKHDRFEGPNIKSCIYFLGHTDDQQQIFFVFDPTLQGSTDNEVSKPVF